MPQDHLAGRFRPPNLRYDVLSEIVECAFKGMRVGTTTAGHSAPLGNVDAAVAYHGADTDKYLGEVDNLRAPLLMHLGEEDEFISKAAQAQINRCGALLTRSRF